MIIGLRKTTPPLPALALALALLSLLLSLSPLCATNEFEQIALAS
jgi:hypothetical protein